LSLHTWKMSVLSAFWLKLVGVVHLWCHTCRGSKSMKVELINWNFTSCKQFWHWKGPKSQIRRH
jgi:hypothetical protein